MHKKGPLTFGKVPGRVRHSKYKPLHFHGNVLTVMLLQVSGHED
jgi:hypothetical protein